MRFIGTKSTLPLSKAIMWLSGDDCSHFAVRFDTLGVVMHSNLVGIHIDLEDLFFDHGEVQAVHEINIPMDADAERRALTEIQSALRERLADEGKTGYDWGAFFYQAWRLFLWRVFKKPIPQKNDWANRDRFLCTELYDMLPNWIYPVVLEFEDMGMVRPSQMFEVWSRVRPPDIKVDVTV